MVAVARFCISDESRAGDTSVSAATVPLGGASDHAPRASIDFPALPHNGFPQPHPEPDRVEFFRQPHGRALDQSCARSKHGTRRILCPVTQRAIPKGLCGSYGILCHGLSRNIGGCSVLLRPLALFSTVPLTAPCLWDRPSAFKNKVDFLHVYYIGGSPG